jgi:hypothetical protein
MLTITAVAVTATADESFIVLTYGMASPTGDLETYTPDNSFRGWGFEYRNLLRDRLSLGFGFAWQSFSRLEQGTFINGNLTVTGSNIREVDSIPIMVTGGVYTGDPGGARVYANLGVGTYYVTNRFDFGTASSFETSWHFGLSPEVGLMLPLGASLWNILGNVKYNYGFKTSEQSALSYWGLNLGLAFNNY